MKSICRSSSSSAGSSDKIDENLRELGRLTNEELKEENAAQEEQLLPVDPVDETLIRPFVKDLKNVLGKGSVVEQKSFLRSLVKKVEVRTREIAIEYTLPLGKAGEPFVKEFYLWRGSPRKYMYSHVARRRVVPFPGISCRSPAN